MWHDKKDCNLPMTKLLFELSNRLESGCHKPCFKYCYPQPKTHTHTHTHTHTQEKEDSEKVMIKMAKIIEVMSRVKTMDIGMAHK